MIAQKTIDAVLDAVQIYDVVKDFVQLRRSGSGWTGLCPFHSERTASFHVDPRRNIYKCFSCGEGGGAVRFLMENRNMSYPDAIRHIAGLYNIPVEEAPHNLTDEQRKLALQREGDLAALETVQQFFEQSLVAGNTAAKRACSYASKRWTLEYCRANGIGYAPYPKEFFEFVKQKGVSLEALLDTGMIRKREDGHFSFMFANRITIPIHDRFGRVIAYTARSLDDNTDCKYLNSTTSCVYKKGNTVFGIEIARKAARKAGFLYVVEGAPDVLRLQSVGSDNAVAALGTEWTATQFEAIKGISDTLCFIPDSEIPKEGEIYSPGTKAVMKNGREAVDRGFRVVVREIPLDNGAEKNDPDSYCTTPAILSSLEEQDFVLWYAEKAFLAPTTQLGRTEVIKDLCAMLAAIEDATLASMYLEQLIKKYKERTAWKLAFNTAQMRKRNESGKDGVESENERDLFSRYGFFIANNCYCTYGKQSEVIRLSNFILLPMYDIPDEGSMTRLYKIVNDLGHDAIIPLEPDDLVNLALFRKKINIAGRYVWLGKIDDLMRVEEYIFRKSESAKRIRTLGWQPEGFFAYGDGIYTDRFIRVDEIGMVSLRGYGIFYLPAFSVMYRDNRLRFAFEKSFTYTHKADVSMAEYLKLFVDVFGDNGKVAIAFIFATLFPELIFEQF